MITSITLLFGANSAGKPPWNGAETARSLLAISAARQPPAVVPYDVTMVLESVEVLHVQVLPESTNGARRFTVTDFVVFGSPVFCSSGNQISTNLLPPVEPTA